MNETRRRIEEDARAALKAGQRERVSALRMVSADLTNRRIELGRELSEDDVLEVLARARKQRLEAETQYREAGRDDLADREAAEAAIIEGYLPKPLADDELDRLIDEAIAETGATGPREMGAVMGRLMPRVKGRAEGGDVSRRVRDRLNP